LDKDKRCIDIISEVTIIRNNLRHSNIVKYLQTFKKDDCIYIVMDLIDGSPLSYCIQQLKDKNERFYEDRIWNIFIQMVLALKYLHKDKYIIHRDLSTNNIMLGDKDIVKITDFGLAKLKETNLTRMTPAVGNLIYMCPEIIKNESYNEKADIWALGCVLFELCCLESAFYSTNMLSLATKVNFIKESRLAVLN
jgi:serine/threonine protein kinase